MRVSALNKYPRGSYGKTTLSCCHFTGELSYKLGIESMKPLSINCRISKLIYEVLVCLYFCSLGKWFSNPYYRLAYSFECMNYNEGLVTNPDTR